jgi:RNA polymerase sigma-70 factor, ECF subfamily
MPRSIARTNENSSSAAAGIPLDDAPIEDGLARAIQVHGKALYARALWLARGQDDAWDLFQGTIEQALRAPNRNIGPENLGRWLMVIMHNHFVDGVRRYDRRMSVPLTEQMTGHLRDPEPRIEEAWESIDGTTLGAAVARLPPLFSKVFQLYSAGASYQDIGIMLDLPPKTVGTRLYRARAKLRGMLLDRIAGAGETERQ